MAPNHYRRQLPVQAQFYRHIYHAYEVALDANLADLRQRLLGGAFEARQPERIFVLYRTRFPGHTFTALVRGCGQAYALQTVEPVTSRCGTRRVCQARSSGSERYTRARPHAVAPVLVPVSVDSPRRYTGAMNAIDERACGKPGCDNFGKPGLNIVGHGWFVTTSGRRRWYRCTVCGGPLSTNTGTAYRGLRCSRREFDQVASLRVEGVSISATARVTGHSRTVQEPDRRRPTG